MSFALSLAGDVVEVEAGATTPVALTVVNRGETTDRYELEIEGIDPEWTSVPVPAFSVEPGESRSEKFFFTPKRLPENVAGAYPFVVRVRSLESGEAKTAQGLLKLLPFNHLTMEISPKKGVVSPTTHRNDYRLSLVNLGNAEQTVHLSAQDPDDRCAYEFESEAVTLGPGQQREVEMTADPKQKPFLSNVRLIGFSVVARGGDRGGSTTVQAQLEQRSLLSLGSLVGIGLVALLVGGWYLMRPVAPTLDLTVSPLHAVKGDAMRISWIAKNADHVEITVGDETVYKGPAVGEPISVIAKDDGDVEIVGTVSRDGHPGTGDRESVQVSEPEHAPEAKIADFSTTTKRLKLGSSFVANWKVANAAQVAIEPLPDTLSADREQLEITPTTLGEQTYTLVATNAEGKSVRKTLTVEVYDESDARILAFGAEPTTVKEIDGGRTVLSWQATGAERVELTVGTSVPVQVDPSGSREVVIGAKTVFVLTAYDEKGRRVSKRLAVLFEKAPPPVDPVPDPASTTSSGGTGLPPDPNFPDKIPPPTPVTTP